MWWKREKEEKWEPSLMRWIHRGREDSHCRPTCVWWQDFRQRQYCFLPFMWFPAPRIRGSVRISVHTSCTAQSRPALLCTSPDNPTPAVCLRESQKHEPRATLPITPDGPFNRHGNTLNTSGFLEHECFRWQCWCSALLLYLSTLNGR